MEKKKFLELFDELIGVYEDKFKGASNIEERLAEFIDAQDYITSILNNN